MKAILLFISFSTFSMAQNFDRHFDGIQLRENKGMVTVLEAPLFGKADVKSPVIQYIRKGEEIYIHPAEFQRDLPGGMAKERLDDNEKPSEHPDPLFANEDDVYRPNPDSLFYKTLSSSGRDAYVLKEHVFLLYKDLREIQQKVSQRDPTDYRIEEPLPEGYPILQPTGFRGYASFSLGIPQQPAYEYNSSINDTGYDFLKELGFVWSRNVDFDHSRRFFFGGMMNIAFSEMEYKLEGRNAVENNFKLSLGPLVSYDLWRNDDYRFNAHTSLQLALIDNLDIEQSGGGLDDTRSFSSVHFAPRIGASLQKSEFLNLLDLLIGVNVNWELPRQYSTNDGADAPEWWKGDTFNRPSNLQITYFLGLQNDY